VEAFSTIRRSYSQGAQYKLAIDSLPLAWKYASKHDFIVPCIEEMGQLVKGD
jgi:hypothetical protein